ncbi:MAG TPA: hypothetical protein VNL15_03105 [Dehalococcoidia bacterium]|nr:hypothetical protein [Dehalococcoidia bacterium]
MLKALPHADLRLHYVWVPMLPKDSAEAAEVAAKRFSSSLARHYWDEGLHLAKLLASSLKIRPDESRAPGKEGVAWDVYLAYPRGAARITEPALWMHQLWLTHGLRLDVKEFHQRVGKLLSASE